jgi:hypothetical protein
MRYSLPKEDQEKNMSPEKHAALREEYRGCSEKIGRLDNLIWQTASVILPIILAGFAYFGSSINHTPEKFLVVFITGVGSMALLVTWYMLSRTWYFYQMVAFYRIQEIETELGLWHYRYSIFLRKSNEERKIELEQIKGDEKKRFQKIAQEQPNIPRLGLRKTTTILTVMFFMGWGALIIREYFLSF